MTLEKKGEYFAGRDKNEGHSRRGINGEHLQRNISGLS